MEGQHNPEIERREKAIAQLRETADWLEKTKAPVDFWSIWIRGYPETPAPDRNVPSVKLQAAATARLLGNCEKDAEGEQFVLRAWPCGKNGRGTVEYEWWTQRENVCEPVVVGKRTITIPAQPAKPEQPEQTIEEDVIEWKCPPALLAPEKEAETNG